MQPAELAQAVAVRRLVEAASRRPEWPTILGSPASAPAEATATSAPIAPESEEATPC